MGTLTFQCPTLGTRTNSGIGRQNSSRRSDRTCHVVAQFKDPKFLDDNSRWMRVTEKEWQARGDGVLLSEHVTLPKPLQNAPEKLLEALLKNAKSFTLLGHLGAGKMPAREIATQVREAPLLMLVTMNCKRFPPGQGATRWMWLSMGMLIQNVLLAATALKIGVQFVSAPLESAADREQIRQLFNVPTSHEIITLLRMGYVEAEDGGFRTAANFRICTHRKKTMKAK